MPKLRFAMDCVPRSSVIYFILSGKLSQKHISEGCVLTGLIPVVITHTVEHRMSYKNFKCVHIYIYIHIIYLQTCRTKGLPSEIGKKGIMHALGCDEIWNDPETSRWKIALSTARHACTIQSVAVIRVPTRSKKPKITYWFGHWCCEMHTKIVT